ncbi:MAG TPA: RNA-binding protein, partial [Phycisphaerales bacterium]|nr:RNA-binding protein [Phycisphaerales bacterium]
MAGGSAVWGCRARVVPGWMSGYSDGDQDRVRPLRTRASIADAFSLARVQAAGHVRFKGKRDQIQMKLYVGNLSFKTTEDALRGLFEAHGEVSSAQLVMDRETGRPRGFGFVEMPDDGQARAAIEALNGQNIDGRDLTVNEARPREDRGGGGGGRGGFGGGRGGGG